MNRNSPVLKSFHEQLAQDARHAYQEKNYPVALQIEEFLSKGTSLPEDAISFTFRDVIQSSDPLTLLAGLTGSRAESLKEKVLLSLTEILPDRWEEIYKNALFQEENPRILSVIFEKLRQSGELEAILDRIFTQPHRYPSLFLWVCENSMNPENKFYSIFKPRLDGRFLIHVLTALDEPQFSSLRSRLKNSLEKGLMLQIVQSSLQKTEAEKAVRLLEHSTNLEDYRRDRLKALIFTWVPEMKQKDDRIFTTQEALTRKKKELEQLVQVELPTNRRAVGEAAAHGDLRENAEYKAARERQDYLISRVEVLQQEIAKARVLEPGQIECSEVRPGTRVTLQQTSGNEITVTILGLWDSNPKEGIYSYQSGVGANLLGKTEGEPAEVQGENWIVKKIEPWMGG
jgi:transcription elongation GreA/GreB family factor